MSDQGTIVELYIYDLTKGTANQVSKLLLGREIEGIWHTAVVVYGWEFFFGQQGISRTDPCGTILGEPQRRLTLGTTFIPRCVFEDYIEGLQQSTFCGDKYDLVRHNCNNFSNELSNFLVGQSIPSYILDLPEEILSTPVGKAFLTLLEQLSDSCQTPHRNRGRESPELQQLNSAIEEVSEVNTTPKRKYRVRMAENVEVINDAEGSDGGGGGGGKNPAEVVDEIEAEERREREERKKQREPPVVFKDAIDVRVEFDALVGLIDGKLNQDEMTAIEELHQYMLEDEGSWALGDGFLHFVDRLLNDKSLGEEIPVRTLNVLACAALKDDIILLLHQDRREHILMNYAHDVDRLPLEQQKSLGLFVCNLFENLSSSEWLLYISEWQYCNTQISNIRVTTKVAVNSLLSDDAELRDRGTAIIHNLACKEVFDDVAVELAMALLQFFNGSPPEEQLFRCMKALARFCQISSQDVPQLIQMIGPPPTKFNGISERIDEQIELIVKKLR